MPRTLPAALTAAMDSGSFKTYLAIGKRNYSGNPPSALTGYTTLITSILYYKYNGLELTVRYASPNLPETDGLIVGEKYYIERGVTIAGVKHTIKSASLRFDDFTVTKQVITANFSLFSNDEKPAAVAGNDTWTNVLTALNPNAYQLGTVDFKATPENTNHWDYKFLPTGKQVSLKSSAALLSLIRQKYLVQATDNSDDSNADEIQFFHLRSPTALGDWTAGETGGGGVSVCYSPTLNKFIAVDGKSGTAGKLRSSTDGIDWTESASPGGTMYTAAWIEELDLFVIGGGDFSGSKRLFTSPDGITWTGRDTANANNYIRGFAYCRGNLGPGVSEILVLVTNLAGNAHNVQTSPDGITWTQRTTPGTPQFYAVAWSPEASLFAAVGTEIHTSPDGITWTQRHPSGTFYSVVWSSELEIFVAVGNGGTVYTSPDGITWTSRTAATAKDWKSVTWASSLSLFVAVADSGTGNRSMTSPDGIAWTSKPTPADENYTSIIHADELETFVAVAYLYNMHADNITQTADHTITRGDITLLKDAAIQAFLWRDEASTIHTNGTETSLIHNLGYLESTDQPPASLRNSDRASVTTGIHLKYKTGDIFTLQVRSGQTATYIGEVTEILDPKAEIRWRCEISLIERFSNTNAGAMPGTIERVAAYTPLVTSNFNGNLDETVNNLQALAEKIDELTIGSEWGDITGTLSEQSDLQAALDDKADADTLTSHTSNVSNPHSVTAAQVAAVPNDGWNASSDTWTRTGNYTFTVSGDVTATYRKSAKVRYKDGGAYEYGYIISSSYSAPNTTVTLATNSDYAMAAATITDKYISYIENPEGFPKKFNFTPTWTNLTVGNATQVAWFVIENGILKGNVILTCAASSSSLSISGTGITLAYPVSPFTTYNYQTLGAAGVINAGIALYMGETIDDGGVMGVRVIKTDGTYAVWTYVTATVPFAMAESDKITVEFSYVI
jgi:hypothetical protein